MSDEKELMANITPFGLRMQPDLKARIAKAAKDNNRSMNAEIIDRLERSEALMKKHSQEWFSSLQGAHVPFERLHISPKLFSNQQHDETIREQLEKLYSQMDEVTSRQSILIQLLQRQQDQTRS